MQVTALASGQAPGPVIYTDALAHCSCACLAVDDAGLYGRQPRAVGSVNRGRARILPRALGQRNVEQRRGLALGTAIQRIRGEGDSRHGCKGKQNTT